MLRRYLLALIWTTAAIAAQSGIAAERTVVLSVPSMYCALCPLSVRKALEKVPGVQKVKATYEPKEAVVTFDDAKASVEQLTEATKRAGFASSVKPGK